MQTAKTLVAGEVGDKKAFVLAFGAVFAAGAHGTQRRKYTGEPYVYHCVEVGAHIVLASAKDSRLTDDVIIAAALHDVLEDTAVTYDVIKENFGPVVADLVVELTDVKTEGNRAQRKAADRERLSKVSYEAASIKYCDLINNTKSISEHDPKFASLYLQEKRMLLQVMRQGNQALLSEAEHVLEQAEKKLSNN